MDYYIHRKELVWIRVILCSQHYICFLGRNLDSLTKMLGDPSIFTVNIWFANPDCISWVFRTNALFTGQFMDHANPCQREGVDDVIRSSRLDVRITFTSLTRRKCYSSVSKVNYQMWILISDLYSISEEKPFNFERFRTGDMKNRKDNYIENLGLIPLSEEGGYFVETYRSPEIIQAKEREGNGRSLFTTIYYMIAPELGGKNFLNSNKSDITHFFSRRLAC